MKITKQQGETPFYTIYQQDTIFLKSELMRYKKLVEELQGRYLHQKNVSLQAENDLLQDKLLNAQEQLKINEEFEEELLKEKNILLDTQYRLELKLQKQQDELYDKSLKINSIIDNKHEVDQELLLCQNEIDSLKKELEQQDDQLLQMKENMELQQLEMKKLSTTKKQLEQQLNIENIANEKLKTDVQSKKAHLKDLKDALELSEETKRELLDQLLEKSQNLESLLSERKYLHEKFNHAKQQLIEAEKMKVDFFWEIIEAYKKQFEENEWWLSNQFADIDRTTKQQEKKLEVIEKDQQNSINNFKDYKEKVLKGFQDVDEKFSHFVEQLDSIRDHNHKMSHNLFEIKEFVEKQKRSQAQFIMKRQNTLYGIRGAQPHHNQKQNQKHD
jgi:chromosome segregation ATPase